MISHRETRFVPFAAELMYAVVSDVEKYPDSERQSVAV